MALRTRTPSRPVRGTEVLDLVDTALSMAGRRELLTTEEATDLLEGVRNKVRDAPERDAEVARIVAAAKESFAEIPLVDRSRVVDALLDLRLVLSAGVGSRLA